MRVLSFIFALLLATGPAVTAWGADLTKINRTIAKEPVYKHKPKYCLLAFGPEAKFRVWLVQDGDVLYVDKNGNGDLTEKGAQCRAAEPHDEIAPEHGYELADGYRVWKVGDLVEPDGKTKHAGLEVSHAGGFCLFNVRTHGHLEYVPGVFTQLQFADRPQDAPIIHFAGPPAAFLRTRGNLIRGETVRLSAAIGTRGLGKGAFAIACVCGDDDKLIGEIEFPPKFAGAKPIKVPVSFGRF